MANTKPARGMRDFLPSDVRKRNYVIGIIKEVYESYGFEPLETPAVENIKTLTGKYGEEGNQLIFKILKRGEKLDVTADEKDLSDLALRYDLTVPLARVVANHKNELPKFFKRYQIQPVWRADRPARGRYREFYQCDVDAIGSSSMIVEAELCAAVSEILDRLGFENFVIRVNHRKVLAGILEGAGVILGKQNDALIALDKIDKIGREGVEKEFNARGINNESAIKLLSFFEFFIKDKSSLVFDEKEKRGITGFQKKIQTEQDNLKIALNLQEKIKNNKKLTEDEYQQMEFLIKWINERKERVSKLSSSYSQKVDDFNKESQTNIKINTETSKEINNFSERSFQNLTILLDALDFSGENANVRNGFVDLWEFLNLLSNTKIESFVEFDLSLARGLSYYTGAIFEINVPDLAGSLGGGGRYDGLIGMFGKEQIPACGFSLGLERILVVMEERGMFPKELSDASADVMVTVWNAESIGESLKLAAELRREKLRVLVYPEADKLGKQFKYADSIKVPFVCVLGESELAENKVTLKNLRTGEQETVTREEIAAKIESILLSAT